MNTTVVSTWSPLGWERYGKYWSNSMSKFSLKDWNIKVYADPQNYPFEWVDWNKEFPGWEGYLKDLRNSFDKRQIRKKHVLDHAIKFSYKSFVIINELEKSKDRYLLWVDGDAIFHKTPPDNWLETLLNGKSIATLFEYKKGEFVHCETGLLLFDLHHPDIKNYRIKFKEYYYDQPGKVFELIRPFDSFAAAAVIKNLNLDVTNLNLKQQDITGKMEETFTNPILSEYITHYIMESKDLLSNEKNISNR